MNLLRDPWLPLLEDGAFRHASLRDVLCSEGERRLSLGRDDMELAALQLAICLVQAVLPPADKEELRKRVAEPISPDEYDRAAAAFLDWFDLMHPKHPFMQVRGVKAKEATPVQKLFPGLPAGEGTHALFNAPGEVGAVCPSCAAIALFNQAGNAPSFGGGFKGSLRGGAPVTTLIQGESLRKTLWLNVLHRESVAKRHEGEWGEPVWAAPIACGAKISVSSIGFLRGLFWQPVRLLLQWDEAAATCGSCGIRLRRSSSQFRTEQFKYDLVNAVVQWPHPHGPRQWRIKKSSKSEFFVSLRKTAPAWTQLTGFLMEQEREKEGWTPAPVVSQFTEVFPGERLNLMIGGYKNKQAKILERRHELYSLTQGWDENMDQVRRLLELALEVKKLLCNKASGFGKKIGLLEMGSLAEQRFYARSESELPEFLRTMDWRETGPAKRRLTERLSDLAEKIFDEIGRPYLHQPKALRRHIKTRHALRGELAALREKS